jgi:monoamine oxidase
MYRPDLIILGAGAAGLSAAEVLSKKGCSILLIEGRERIGGRIFTLHDHSFAAPVELGAEFIHGQPESTWEMVRRAKLVSFDLPFDHRVRRGGHLIHLGDVSAELKKAMGGLAHLGKRDISFAQYLRNRRWPASLNEARRFAINFVQGFDAADPERISAQSLAEEQRGIGDVGEETQFRLLDGYGALVEFLRGELDRDRVEIRLRTVVSEIRWRKGHVEVRAHGEDGPMIYRAPRVLITLPVGVLQLPPETVGSIRFTPDLAGKRKAAMQIGSGPIVKAVFTFREAFWEKSEVAERARSDAGLRDAVFLHDPKAAFPTWWTSRPLRVPMLTAWAGGPKAVALAGMKREEIESAAMESLGELLGQRPRKLAGLVAGFHYADWASDPLARGAYSFVTVGGNRARAALAKPIERTIFFAGEATDTSGQASTVAGALASGQRAAKELLRVIDR